MANEPNTLAEDAVSALEDIRDNLSDIKDAIETTEPEVEVSVPSVGLCALFLFFLMIASCDMTDKLRDVAKAIDRNTQAIERSHK